MSPCLKWPMGCFVLSVQTVTHILVVMILIRRSLTMLPISFRRSRALISGKTPWRCSGFKKHVRRQKRNLVRPKVVILIYLLSLQMHPGRSIFRSQLPVHSLRKCVMGLLRGAEGQFCRLLKTRSLTPKRLMRLFSLVALPESRRFRNLSKMFLGRSRTRV